MPFWNTFWTLFQKRRISFSSDNDFLGKQSSAGGSQPEGLTDSANWSTAAVLRPGSEDGQSSTKRRRKWAARFHRKSLPAEFLLPIQAKEHEIAAAGIETIRVRSRGSTECLDGEGLIDRAACADRWDELQVRTGNPRKIKRQRSLPSRSKKDTEHKNRVGLRLSGSTGLFSRSHSASRVPRPAESIVVPAPEMTEIGPPDHGMGHASRFDAYAAHQETSAEIRRHSRPRETNIDHALRQSASDFRREFATGLWTGGSIGTPVDRRIDTPPSYAEHAQRFGSQQQQPLPGDTYPLPNASTLPHASLPTPPYDHDVVVYSSLNKRMLPNASGDFDETKSPDTAHPFRNLNGHPAESRLNYGNSNSIPALPATSSRSSPPLKNLSGSPLNNRIANIQKSASTSTAYSNSTHFKQRHSFWETQTRPPASHSVSPSRRYDKDSGFSEVSSSGYASHRSTEKLLAGNSATSDWRDGSSVSATPSHTPVAKPPRARLNQEDFESYRRNNDIDDGSISKEERFNLLNWQNQRLSVATRGSHPSLPVSNGILKSVANASRSNAASATPFGGSGTFPSRSAALYSDRKVSPETLSSGRLDYQSDGPSRINGNHEITNGYRIIHGNGDSSPRDGGNADLTRSSNPPQLYPGDNVSNESLPTESYGSPRIPSSHPHHSRDYTVNGELLNEIDYFNVANSNVRVLGEKQRGEHSAQRTISPRSSKRSFAGSLHGARGSPSNFLSNVPEDMLVREDVSISPYHRKQRGKHENLRDEDMVVSQTLGYPLTPFDDFLVPESHVNLPPNSGSNEYGVVVAIDFGTAFSGYAFAFRSGVNGVTHGDVSRIQTMRKPQGGDPGISNQKLPTCLLLTAEGHFHAFGYAARDYFHDLEPQKARKYLFFDQFKMRLHSENLSMTSCVQSTSGKPALVLDVLAHALRYFKQLALADVSDQVGHVVEPQDLLWVVTVPAIWRQDAKQIMREASYKAGLASPLHPNQLLIALEPEAAALYCRHLESHEVVSFPDDSSANSGSSGGGSGSGHSAPLSHYGGGSSVRHAKGDGGERLRAVQLAPETVVLGPGDGYLVVDCGGGTVDITAHQLAQDGRTLKEIFQASGGPYGSSSVDRAFEALLADLFTVEFLNSFRNKYPASYVDLLVAFEAKKRCVSPYKLNALNVSLPFSFVEHYKKVKGHKVEQAVKKFGGRHVSWTAQGMLRLSSELMHSLFEPTLVGIKRSISDVLAAVEFFQELHYLFLVGGFAESALVQNFVRKMVAGKLKVIIPQDVSLAVMKGAVLFGINPQSVAVRRARLTYGVGVLHRWDADRHPLDKRICKAGTDWCTDVFDPFVVVGQSLSCGDRVSRLYCPATPNQREIVIQIYCTATALPKFVTDPGVVKCGVLRLALDPHGHHGIRGGVKVLPGQDPKLPPRRREIEASMSFGETELKISAIDKETGTCVDCCIDFLKEERKQ